MIRHIGYYAGVLVHLGFERCSVSLAIPSRRLNYAEKALIYGLLGLCVEVIFTAIAGFEVNLKGHTYLWMIPVWASGLFALAYTNKLVSKSHILIRGLIYAVVCMGIEYAFGIYFLLTLGIIPWDYSYAEWNIHGAIRLDYFPFWFVAGLVSEKVIHLIDRLSIRLTN